MIKDDKLRAFENIEAIIADDSISGCNLDALKKHLRSITPPPIFQSQNDKLRIEIVTSTLRSLIATKETEAQFKVSIRWARIAGIAAILAVVLTLYQIWLSIYQYKSEQSEKKQEVQQPKPDDQQPTKSQQKETTLKNNSHKKKLP